MSKPFKKTRLAALACMSLLLLSVSGCFSGSNSTSSPHPATDSDKTTTTSAEPPAATQPTPATTDTSSSASPATDTGTTPATSPFPQVVQDAMKQFSNSPVPLYAPTFIPNSRSSAQQVTSRTWTGTGNEYYVQLLQPSGPMTILGGFSGQLFASDAIAAANVNSVAGDMDLAHPGYNAAQGKLTTGTVDLGTGITGQTYVFKADQPSAKALSQYAGIAWQEGRWNLQVVTTVSTTLPIDTAKAVVAYLHDHFLPVPQTRGAVVVNVQAEGQLMSTAAWQKGSAVYSTSNTNEVANPVTAALEMAVSMQPYQ